MILFKEISIQPSRWHLDIIVSKSKPSINKFCKQRYGVDNYYDGVNECSHVESDKDSELKGYKRIVVILESLNNKSIIAHELIHALWFSAKAIGYEMNYDSQEWQAVLFEYLFNEVTNRKDYIKK